MSDQQLTVAEGKAVAEVAPAQPGQLISAILELARDPNFDATKLEALAKFQMQMEDRQAERLYNEALARVQSELPQIEKLGTIRLVKDGIDKGSIPFTRWEDIDKVIRPILTRHNFTLSFSAEERQAQGGGIIVTGTLRHAAGHSDTASLPVALDTGAGRNNLQAMGSSVAYGKRYVTEMLLNIVRKGEDDDGKSGGTQYLTAEQLAEIKQLVADTHTDEQTMLRAMRTEAEAIGEIEQKDYVRIRNALLAKKRTMEKSQ